MNTKHHGGPAPVPPGNRPHAGHPAAGDDDVKADKDAGAAFNDQDPQRRLGDFVGAGEHSIQQPSNLNDGTKHSK